MAQLASRVSQSNSLQASWASSGTLLPFLGVYTGAAETIVWHTAEISATGFSSSPWSALAKASEYLPLNFSPVAVAAGGQHFTRLSQQKAQTEAVAAPLLMQKLTQGRGQRAGTVLDLPSPGQKKIQGSFKTGKPVLELGGVQAFSVFCLARRELGGELVVISNLVPERCFLAEGFLF